MVGCLSNRDTKALLPVSTLSSPKETLVSGDRGNPGTDMRIKWIYAVLLIIPALSAGGAELAKIVPDYQLMLFGGDLHVCRSTAMGHCNSKGQHLLLQQVNRRHQLYKVSPPQVDKLMKAALWQADRQAIRLDLQYILQSLARQVANRTLTHSQLINLWKGVQLTRNGRQLSGHSLFLQLDQHEYQMVLDFLELPAIDDFGRRMPEQIALPHSKSTIARELLQQFVRLAGTASGSAQPPELLLVTTGERDLFAGVDAWRQLLEAVGARVRWLPLDGALNRLWADKADCSRLEHYRNRLRRLYDRDRIYPDLVEQQQSLCRRPEQLMQWLASADGILMTGQQPQLLAQAWLTAERRASPALELLHRRARQGELVVAAVAGGTRAMSGGVDFAGKQTAMLIDGSSEMGFIQGSVNQAKQRHCRSARCREPLAETLRYNGDGGIGLFPWGVLDIGLSEHARQGRLGRVSYDNGNRFGIGVDHNTALLVSLSPPAEAVPLAVIGEGGVMIIDHRDTGMSDDGGLLGMSLSYVTQGDSALLTADGLTVSFAEWKQAPSRLKTVAVNQSNLFYGNNFRQFTEQACFNQASRSLGYGGKKRQFEILLERSARAQIMIGGIKRESGYSFYCSYQNLRWSISKR